VTNNQKIKSIEVFFAPNRNALLFVSLVLVFTSSLRGDVLQEISFGFCLHGQSRCNTVVCGCKTVKYASLYDVNTWLRGR